MNCIEVETGRDRHGYGKTNVWVGMGAEYVMYAHRIAFEQAWGAIPDGMFVRHSCDNRGCVNPLHLMIGTHRDNMFDMSSRGRSRNGREGMIECRRGHLIDGLRPDGRRYCKTCKADSKRRRTEQKREIV